MADIFKYVCDDKGVRHRMAEKEADKLLAKQTKEHNAKVEAERKAVLDAARKPAEQSEPKT